MDRHRYEPSPGDRFTGAHNVAHRSYKETFVVLSFLLQHLFDHAMRPPLKGLPRVPVLALRIAVMRSLALPVVHFIHRRRHVTRVLVVGAVTAVVVDVATIVLVGHEVEFELLPRLRLQFQNVAPEPPFQVLQFLKRIS